MEGIGEESVLREVLRQGTRLAFCTTQINDDVISVIPLRYSQLVTFEIAKYAK